MAHEYLSNQRIADLADATDDDWAALVALPVAHGVALAVLGKDHPERHDAVQLAAMKLLGVRAKLRLDRNPFGYLSTVAFRECVSVARKGHGYDRLKHRLAKHLSRMETLSGFRVETSE